MQNLKVMNPLKFEISRGLGFENAMGRTILNDVGLVTFIKCWVCSRIEFEIRRF
jgi:hypothetical protein